MYTTKVFTRTVALAAVASSLAFVQHEAKAIEFEISSIPGTAINFVGAGGMATVSFSSVAGESFQIDNVNGGIGSAAGKHGVFAGSWTMGPVTTLSVVPLVEVAPISGTGTLTIFDGTDTLTATIAWVQANSLKTGPFSVAVIGVQGNISGATYSGSNADLIAFAAGAPQSGFVSFDFGANGKSLTQLVAAGAVNHTTYSGSLSTTAVPDSGTTLMLLGLGLCGLAVIRPRR